MRPPSLCDDADVSVVWCEVTAVAVIALLILACLLVLLLPRADD